MSDVFLGNRVNSPGHLGLSCLLLKQWQGLVEYMHYPEAPLLASLLMEVRVMTCFLLALRIICTGDFNSETAGRSSILTKELLLITKMQKH